MAGKITDKIEKELEKKAAPKTTTRKPKVETKVEEKKMLKDSDKVLVMNNTIGRYGYISPTGFNLFLEEYGDTDYIPFEELRKMASGRAKSHIKKAFIIILDEEAVEQLNLTKDYEYILTPEDINKLLTNPELLKEVLPKLSKVMQEAVIISAKNKFENGELFDNRVASAIKEVAKFDILP